MKVKIESWKDLRPGDVWLGLTVMHVSEIAGIVDLSLPCGTTGQMLATRIALFIAAGNDTVERKPEKVVIEAKGGCTVSWLDENHAGMAYCFTTPSKVTIEPL